MLNYYELLVGSRIKARRLTKGITQEGLANSVGTDQSRVSRWENGHALPDSELRPNLLRALGLSEMQLFGLEQIEAPAVAPKTVAEMPMADFRADLAALKRDDIEAQRLKNKIASIKEDEVYDFWPLAHPAVKAICLRFLTNDARFVASLSAEVRAQLEVLVRLLKKEPSKPQP